PGRPPFSGPRRKLGFPPRFPRFYIAADPLAGAGDAFRRAFPGQGPPRPLRAPAAAPRARGPRQPRGPRLPASLLSRRVRGGYGLLVGRGARGCALPGGALGT